MNNVDKTKKFIMDHKKIIIGVVIAVKDSKKESKFKKHSFKFVSAKIKNDDSGLVKVDIK
ncbi:hypothetical protein [Lactococcus lactis]|uniref:hypothetical protein n=1 Tax=Lactococcus lactis TaxID=1358 RepID=UPI0024A67B33|nr:hypothetical protein [Lactococcus lactis]